jgi:hypothetical protein
MVDILLYMKIDTIYCYTYFHTDPTTYTANTVHMVDIPYDTGYHLLLSFTITSSLISWDGDYPESSNSLDNQFTPRSSPSTIHVSSLNHLFNPKCWRHGRGILEKVWIKIWSSGEDLLKDI